MYEHRFLENIKKLYKSAGKSDDQLQYKIYYGGSYGIYTWGSNGQHSNQCGYIGHAEETKFKKVSITEFQ